MVLYQCILFQDDTRFKQALKIRNPKNRLRRIYDACKGKKRCAGGDDIDVQKEQDGDERNYAIKNYQSVSRQQQKTTNSVSRQQQ